tara:strand:- start:130 stop:402 length:273 start_codon:yes stop_codon:yes gene_type:complete
MGNIEKPLTWGLAIILLSYLFITNWTCGEEASWVKNNAFIPPSNSEEMIVEIQAEDKMQEIKLNEDSLNVDSIIEAVLQEIETETDTVEK